MKLKTLAHPILEMIKGCHFVRFTLYAHLDFYSSFFPSSPSHIHIDPLSLDIAWSDPVTAGYAGVKSWEFEEYESVLTEVLGNVRGIWGVTEDEALEEVGSWLNMQGSCTEGHIPGGGGGG